jgi:hypothetical protein
MAALNQGETRALQGVHTLLSNLLADAKKPPKERQWFATLSPEQERILKEAKANTNMVIQMKGHYPK